MGKAQRVLDWVVDGATWVACICTVLMMLHVSADVIGRRFFGAPLTGTIEIVSAYYMAGIAFLPLALITRERGHIIVELFTTWISKRGLAVLDAIIAMASVAYVVMFTWETVLIAIDKTAILEAREAGTGFVPIWQSRWVVPLGFGLMAIYLVIHIFRDLRGIRTGEGIAPPPPHLTEGHDLSGDTHHGSPL